MFTVLREIIADLAREARAAATGPSRRQFLLWIAGTVAAIAIYFGWMRRVWVPVGPPESIPMDTVRNFEARGSRIFLRRLPDGQILALSQRCSHLGCYVEWKPASERFECPCHEGRFTATGALISGAPVRPLSRFETRIEAGIVEVLL